MNILFSTQSESLRLFNALLGSLAGRLPVERAGFTVADSLFYDHWLKEEHGFDKRGHAILKEWEVTSVVGDCKPDLARLAHYEKLLGGEAGLFGAIVADRRLLMGPDCTYSQDYRRRFSDEQLLCILQKGLEEMERLFDELQPDVVVGFICVTMLDYLVYLFALARRIRYFNLRPTRIGDRVGLVSTLNDPSPELAASFARILETKQSPYLEEARRYLRRAREEHARYEGVVRPSDKPALSLDVKKLSKLDNLMKSAERYRRYRASAASDNHVPSPVRTMYFSWVRNPWLAKKVRKCLQPKYVTTEQLDTSKYVFFPLHTEPEVSLLVYGRPYLNQTEIIRMLALSLPVDTILVVKEHPWMVGKRSLSSYEKMLNIPRVRFADPRLEARVLIQKACMVAVVTGSVGLEAAMLGKPVLTFGDCPFNLLPMVRRCEDPRRLQSIIRDLLERTGDDESVLESYVSAVYETSESVSLYSVLLNKKNVHTERGVTGYREEVDNLSAFLHSLLAENPPKQVDRAAAW